MTKKSEWRAKALTKENFNLEELIVPKLMDLFSEQFEDKEVEVIGVSFFISDKSIDRKENEEEFANNSISVTLTYPCIDDTEKKKMTLRVSKDTETDKVKKTIELFEESL